jgi:hypothetical protein
MSNNRIDVGDVVDVFFDHSEALFRVRVTHKAQQTGDTWALVDERGRVYEVQQFAYMMARPNNTESEEA